MQHIVELYHEAHVSYTSGNSGPTPTLYSNISQGLLILEKTVDALGTLGQEGQCFSKIKNGTENRHQEIPRQESHHQNGMYIADLLHRKGYNHHHPFPFLHLHLDHILHVYLHPQEPVQEKRSFSLVRCYPHHTCVT